MYIILQRNDWKFATEDMDYVVVNPAGDIVFRNMTKSVVEALFMKLSKEATMTYEGETPIPVTYRVTANHVHPDYRFTKTKVKIGYSDYDKTYWASHPKLGCSKSFTTLENAIYSLFHDHACTGVTITKTED